MPSVSGVELVRVGSWPAHTGDGRPWVVTRADLAAAVAAFNARIAVPVLKYGHVETGTDQPALGVVDNLRLTDAGQTLVGDFVGLSAELAGEIRYRWPNRSVEALLGYVDPAGRTWPLVVEAVSLLGASAPAVKGLAPIAAAARVCFDCPVAAAPPNRLRAVKVAAARRRRTHRTLIER